MNESLDHASQISHVYGETCCKIFTGYCVVLHLFQPNLSQR